jgi:uncharacterized repeat protein (TIGR03803 family)
VIQKTGRKTATLIAACAVAGLAAPPVDAGTLTILHNFTGGADGSNPYKTASIDAAGNLYGETTWGANICPDSYQFPGIGCGAVYKLTPSGTTSPLVTFLGASNGATGLANVTLFGGHVVGAAYGGGPANLGLVYAVKTDGTGYVVLHKFAGSDGAHPTSFPRITANQTLYSVTPSGGPGYTGIDGSGDGVLFAILPNRTYQVQHFFSGGADGATPGRIVLDSAGTVFGATSAGGSCTGTGLPANGCGVVYSYVPSTGAFTVLYTFAGGADGYAPQIGAIGPDGSLYGNTSYGGTHSQGTLFKLTKTGTGYSYSTLWAFTGGSDGASPFSPPTLTANGTLVGVTFYGPVTGTSTGAGTLYSLKNGVLTTLFTFTNDANGGYPQGTPIVTSAGAIVGTTAFGGSNAVCQTSTGVLISSFGCGTVFKYVP